MIEDHTKCYELAIKVYFFCFQLFFHEHKHGQRLLFYFISDLKLLIVQLDFSILTKDQMLD
jgi:hypothetical protein